MIKNQSNIYRFPMEDHLGKGVTGLAPTIKLSKDGGNFAASTNSVTEPDTTNAPGLYQLILTAEECNCNLLTLVVNVPTGEWGAIITEFDMQSPSDTSGLATAEALSAVATNVSAVKAKTDALPEHPAAVGSEMALTSAAVSAVRSGLSTFNPANTSVIVNADQAATMRTATGFTTPEQLASATQTIVQAMPSTSGLATSADLTSATNSVLSLLNLVFSGIYHWTVNDTLLTVYNSSNVPIGAYTITKDASGAITAVTPIVTTTNAD